MDGLGWHGVIGGILGAVVWHLVVWPLLAGGRRDGGYFNPFHGPPRVPPPRPHGSGVRPSEALPPHPPPEGKRIPYSSPERWSRCLDPDGREAPMDECRKRGLA